MATITVEIHATADGQWEVVAHDGHVYSNEPIGVAPSPELAEVIRQAYIAGWQDRAWWGDSTVVAGETQEYRGVGPDRYPRA